MDRLKAQQQQTTTTKTTGTTTTTTNTPQVKQDLETARRTRNETFQRLEQYLVAIELCRSWNPVDYDGGYCGGGGGGVDNMVFHDNEVVLNEHCARYLVLHKRVMAEKSLANLAITKKVRFP